MKYKVFIGDFPTFSYTSRSNVHNPSSPLPPLLFLFLTHQNQTRGHKREYPQLAVQEVTASDGAYIGQHSQGLGGQYADYFKRKRL